MRIVLSTSPHVRHPTVLQNDFVIDQAVMYSFAPVGLLALSAMLRATLQIEPVLFDLNQQIATGAIRLDSSFYRNAAARISSHEPDVLGFMTECDSYHHVLQILEQVKQLRPECRCVLGGPHASAVARQTMERRPFVDAIVIGEGERTLPDLVRAFAAGSAAPVPGALRRGGLMGILDGGSRPLASSLDELPIPAYDLYRGTPDEEIFIEAGRGCPFQCTFCSTAPFWQRKHRVKSPKRILSEIALVQVLFGSHRVHFTHDLLTTDRHWVTHLCEALIAAGAPVKWTCSARTDTVDRALLELMAAAGCYAIYFGVESGSARILQDIKKAIPIEESLDVLRLCRDIGIRPNAGFIVGFPTEDRVSLLDTFTAFERAVELGTRPTHIFGFCPFASSSMYGSLDTLACDGHFLDIPMDGGLDAANRALIASDSQLFGSYFRPRIDVSPTRLQGVDEFSSILEPVALPALRLSRAVGGMLEVFDRWTAWIERRNIAAGASPHRRFYGSPQSFCEFVVEELRAVCAADDPMLQLADVIRTGFEVARTWSRLPPTTMATHRSVEVPQVSPSVQLGDQLRLNTVIATKQVDYDLVPLLDAPPDQAPDLERKRTYLMWDLSDDRQVRLSRVDPFLYMALEHLQDGPQPVASLLVEWADQAEGEGLEYNRLMHVLAEARTMRILDTV
ncbi:MAG: B12-binding domain-containing radical SAM protein [Vicinamibacterales bacterium]